MEWNLTMFAVHLIALVFAVMLYGAAPCWMQRAVMFGLALAAGLVAGAYGAVIAGVERGQELRELGLAVEHIAVLLYLFRIVWQRGTEWNKLSDHSRSSPT